jgi:hypothetical protein
MMQESKFRLSGGTGGLMSHVTTMICCRDSGCMMWSCRTVVEWIDGLMGGVDRGVGLQFVLEYDYLSCLF